MLSLPVMLLAAAALFGLDVRGSGNRAGPPLPLLNPGQPASAKTETDTNGDGVVDYIVIFDKNGRKALEESDFNGDGKMDDFLYFMDGVPSKEEIDSSFDGKIDVWVYLSEGIYIQKYERDLNGDGVPDVVKDFGKR